GGQGVETRGGVPGRKSAGPEPIGEDLVIRIPEMFPNPRGHGIALLLKPHRVCRFAKYSGGAGQGLGLRDEEAVEPDVLEIKRSRFLLEERLVVHGTVVHGGFITGGEGRASIQSGTGLAGTVLQEAIVVAVAMREPPAVRAPNDRIGSGQQRLVTGPEKETPH